MPTITDYTIDMCGAGFITVVTPGVTNGDCAFLSGIDEWIGGAYDGTNYNVWYSVTVPTFSESNGSFTVTQDGSF